MLKFILFFVSMVSAENQSTTNADFTTELCKQTIKQNAENVVIMHRNLPSMGIGTGAALGGIGGAFAGYKFAQVELKKFETIDQFNREIFTKQQSHLKNPTPASEAALNIAYSNLRDFVNRNSSFVQKYFDIKLLPLKPTTASSYKPHENLPRNRVYPNAHKDIERSSRGIGRGALVGAIAGGVLGGVAQSLLTRKNCEELSLSEATMLAKYIQVDVVNKSCEVGRVAARAVYRMDDKTIGEECSKFPRLGAIFAKLANDHIAHLQKMAEVKDVNLTCSNGDIGNIDFGVDNTGHRYQVTPSSKGYSVRSYGGSTQEFNFALGLDNGKYTSVTTPGLFTSSLSPYFSSGLDAHRFQNFYTDLAEIKSVEPGHHKHFRIGEFVLKSQMVLKLAQAQCAEQSAQSKAAPGAAPEVLK